jgi:hypothetical protein
MLIECDKYKYMKIDIMFRMTSLRLRWEFAYCSRARGGRRLVLLELLTYL